MFTEGTVERKTSGGGHCVLLHRARGPAQCERRMAGAQRGRPLGLRASLQSGPAALWTTGGEKREGSPQVPWTCWAARARPAHMRVCGPPGLPARTRDQTGQW